MSAVSKRLLPLLTLLVTGCALVDAITGDPDQAEMGGSPDMAFDLTEAPDMEVTPDLDSAPDLDMSPDLDMMVIPDMMPDMAPDMMPGCIDHAPSPAASKATAVAVGQDFSCALLTDQTVKCWGDNTYGQLGTPNNTGRVTGLCKPAVAIGAGAYHACAVLDDGTVACWGAGGHAQLGNGRTGGSPNQGLNISQIYKEPRAVAVSGISEAVSIHAGEFYTCARMQGGGSRCWGRNHRAQLGLGNASNSPTLNPTPQAFPGGATPSGLSAGENGACALLSSGAVACWGRNEYGESGQPNPSSSAQTTAPALVNGLTDPTRVASGSGVACALSLGDTMMPAIMCWGGRDRFKGSNGANVLDKGPDPMRISLVNNAQELYVGIAHGCILNNDGTAQCWGLNDRFQLGNEGVSQRDMLIDVKLPPGIQIDATDATKMDIDANGSHTCAVSEDGDVYCWGDIADGKLGRTDIQSDVRAFPLKVDL